MKSNKIILAVLILSMMITLIFSGCGGGGSVIPPISDNTDDSDSEEIELIEIASGEIDLNEGGVVEVTDPNSELYGLKLTIEPQKNIRKDKGLPVNIDIYFALLETCKLPNHQGFLITPFIIKSDFTDVLFGKLAIPYYMEQLINSGVAINAPVKVCRVSSSPLPWEELSSDKYTVSNNIANIPIGIGDFMYYYTLTVNNAVPPNSSGFKSPQPGDLLYKFSKLPPAKINEGWCSGHVGIYVGERYDEEEDKPYNVIEALLGGVTRSYHSPISEFGGDSIYLGAREPEGGLSHQKRNLIIAFVEGVVGTAYATIETVSSMFWTGLGRGELVKGDNGKFNCVGLAEKAYQLVGIDFVSNYDEGNEKYGPYHILTPAEQWHKTVPSSGVLVQNIPPKISSLEIIPEGPVEVNSLVFVTCNATDQDQDNLTYIWTIPEYGNSTTITKGKSISWGSPNEEGTYIISCKVIDNYGGEDEKSINISVGDINVNHPPVITSIAVTSATKGELYSYDVNATDADGDTPVYSLTTNPNGMTINSSTGLITWTPTATGSFGVTVKASDGELFDTQSFTVTVEETGTTTLPAVPTSLSPGTISAPGPIISTLTPTLQWQAVSNADYYNLSVSIYPYGTSNIIYYNQQVYGNSITIPSGELEAGKKYRWNMRAYNSAGYSDYSLDYYFQTGSTTTLPAVPTSLSPGTTSAPGPIISTLTPTLQWQAVSNADYYNLSVSIYPYGTSNIIYYNQQVYGNSITIPSGELEAGKKYRWNMRAYNSAGYSDYSLDYYFQTGSTTTLPPTLNLVGSGGVSPGSGTPSTTFTYSVYYSDPEGASPTVKNVYIDGSSHTMSGSGSGSTYTYQISGLSAGTHTYSFQFSDGTYTVNLPSSGTYSAPTVTSTVNQNVTLTLYICENSTTGSPLSGVSVAISDGGGNSFNQTTNSSGYVTITGTPGTWSFTAMKSGYDTNSWNQSITSTCTKYGYIKSNVITTPNPPYPFYPGYSSAPGQLISTLTPTLQWLTVSNADYYNLSISIEPYGTSNIIYYNQQIYGGSITVPSGILAAGKKYRWNMRAYNSAGFSEYSITLYFQT